MLFFTVPFNLINIVNNIDPKPIEDRNKKRKKDINDFPSSTNHQNFLGESNVDVPVEKITEIENNIINTKYNLIEDDGMSEEKQVGRQETVLKDDSLENYYTESFSNDQKYNERIKIGEDFFREGIFVINIEDAKRSKKSNKVNLKSLSNCGQIDDEIADEIFEINSTDDDQKFENSNNKIEIPGTRRKRSKIKTPSTRKKQSKITPSTIKKEEIRSCKYCSREVHMYGLWMHEKFCKKKSKLVNN